MRILITGGCGYVGSVLIRKLLKLGHEVINFDTQWFGNYLEKHSNLKNYKKDVREIKNKDLKNIDTVIHLASIANDPMVELDQGLSWEVSCLGTLQLLNYAIENKVKKIIYASSGSVYGVKKKSEIVHENIDLNPISTYNKVKMSTERIILSYRDKINYTIIRPATVCGFSPRMRFDVAVNALSFSAMFKKEITINGGNQIRPNIHINDLVDLYIYFLKNGKYFNGIYNAGFENISIMKIAKKVQKKIPSKINIIKKNFDPRSYRQDSSKLLKHGFKPKYTIDDAIVELKEKFNNRSLKDSPNFHSISWLKKILKQKKIY